MNIGEFSWLTGLSTKALRAYDERGLLPPRATDPWTGYRRYTADQLSSAVLIRAAREAGMPLTEIQRLLEEPERARTTFDQFRSAVTAERERQDAALEGMAALLAEEVQGQAVEERTAPEQHWAGIVLTVTHDEEEDGERADEAFTALGSVLIAEGRELSGPFWSSLRDTGEDGTGEDGTAELLCCAPVPGPLPADWGIPGWRTETGLLPERTELVVRWSHDAPIPAVEGAVHPAVLMLLTEAELRGTSVSPAQLRQIPLFEDGEPVGVAVTLPLASADSSAASAASLG
ncbi:hypothetical protein GCM10009603_08700 [Nocardiopsis exhalans]